eukprot:gene12588-8627_t
MTSIQELGNIRLYRAFQTAIELCEDRGYVVTHPKRLVSLLRTRPAAEEAHGGAESTTDIPRLSTGSSSAACVSFPWFMDHFSQSSEEVGAGKTISPSSMTLVGVQRRSGAPPHRPAAGSDVHPGEKETETDANARPRVSRFKQEMMDHQDSGVGGTTASVVVKKEDAQTQRRSAAAAAPHLPTAGEEEEEIMVVFFNTSPSLTMKEVSELRTHAASKYKAQHVIIVGTTVSNAVRREARESCGLVTLLVDSVDGKRGDGDGAGPATILAPGKDGVVSVELFEVQQLLFNPSHHETVPKHVVLSEAETQAVLQRHQVTMSQLPRIAESDPLVRYTGATRGMVLRILREGKESGPYNMYRQVI